MNVNEIEHPVTLVNKRVELIDEELPFIRTGIITQVDSEGRMARVTWEDGGGKEWVSLCRLELAFFHPVQPICTKCGSSPCQL